MGRRCQDKGEFLAGDIALGDALVETELLTSGSEMSRPPSNGELFSFVGDVEEPSIASIVLFCRGSKACWGFIAEDIDSDRPLACAARAEYRLGVFAGDDFVGEIDLARSVDDIRTSRYRIKLSCSTVPCCSFG